MGASLEDFYGYTGSMLSTLGSIAGLLIDVDPPDDTSTIVLDGKPILGIVQNEHIARSIAWEHVPIEGTSKTVKLYHGYEDAELTFELLLTTDEDADGAIGVAGRLLSGDVAGFIEGVRESETPLTFTALQKFELLRLQFETFRAGDEAVPRTFKITQEAANAAGIVEVMFANISLRRTSSSDAVLAVVEFIEAQPGSILKDTGDSALPAPTPEDTTSPFEETT